MSFLLNIATHPTQTLGIVLLAALLAAFIWSWRPRFKKVHPMQTLKLRLTPTTVLRIRHMVLLVGSFFSPADRKECRIVEQELRRRGKLA